LSKNLQIEIDDFKQRIRALIIVQPCFTLRNRAAEFFFVFKGAENSVFEQNGLAASLNVQNLPSALHEVPA
jgi:hypothetical protein